MTPPPLPRCRVVVTACGVVSPLGFGQSAQAQALFDREQGAIGPVTRFPTDHNRCRVAAEVDQTPLGVILSRSRQTRRLHPASAMLIAALEEIATADPGFVPCRSCFGTTSVGMSFGEAFFRRVRAGSSRRGAATEVAHYMPQKPVLDALNHLGWPTGIRMVSNACASGTNALGLALAEIRTGRAKRVLAGGYDALAELVFCGFDALQAMSALPCRPFDHARDGLNLGEAASVLALEEAESAAARGAPVLAELSGYGAATDTHHLTQPHPDGSGPRLAMERALANAGLGAESIDYLNAHGTATPLNDASEAAAIAALLPPSVAVSSTKGFTGHTLGAAGALEAVFCLLALKRQKAPINLGLVAPDPAVRFQLVTAATPAQLPIRRVMSNSLGFGGANASVIFSEVNR